MQKAESSLPLNRVVRLVITGQKHMGNVTKLVELLQTRGTLLGLQMEMSQFGSQDWYDWFAAHTEGDTISLELTVTQFVVGQWTVQDLQKPPINYIKPNPIAEGWNMDGVAAWLQGVLSNPIFQLVILGIVAIVLMGLLIFVFPDDLS